MEVVMPRVMPRCPGRGGQGEGKKDADE